MTRHFLRELEQLKRDVSLMGGQAESAVARAMRAFQERDCKSAEQVVSGDRETNAMELRIEEECLKILSLYAPAARDLRFVVAAFKITNDLERVGDLAVNIAERALNAADDDPHTEGQVLDEMATKVRAMLNTALDAFLAQDEAGARAVLEMDDQVDELLEGAYRQQIEVVGEDGRLFRSALLELSAAKHLERIADHATNIAEDVVYMVTGEVVKHHR